MSIETVALSRPLPWSTTQNTRTGGLEYGTSSILLIAQAFVSHEPYREPIREYVAEFFGVMILIIFGAGVDCQVVLSGNTAVASSPKGVSAERCTFLWA